MKKLSLLCAAVLGLALNAAAINPYAYAVSAEESAEGYTVNYSLNVDAASVALQLFDGETLVATVPMTAVTKGAHSETVALPSDLAAGTYTAKVAVTGVAHEFETYADSTKTFTNRYHATVDANPYSPNFGNIYGASRGSDIGTYLINPDYTYVNTTPNMIGQSSWSSVQRGAVAPNGEMWFSSWGDGNSGIYRYDPSVNPNASTQFFLGTRASSGLITNNGEETGCSTPGIAIYSAGKDSKLYMVGEDFTGGSTQGSLAIYNIGQEDGSIVTSWGTAPSAHYNTITDKTGTNFAVCATPYGAWLCQHRALGSNTAGARSLQFISDNGIQKYLSTDAELINGSMGAGIVTNATFDKLWMVDGRGDIMEFNVAWSADTVPTLTKVATYATPFGAIAQMTFDFAGNIVAVGGTGSTAYSSSAATLRLAVFSLPAAEAPVAATPIVGFEVEVEEAGEITWSDFLGNGSSPFVSDYTNCFKYSTPLPQGVGVVNIQTPGFATATGIYMTFPAGISECSLGAGNYDVQGAGIILHCDAFVQQITEVTVVDGLGSYTFYIWNENGSNTPTDLENVEATEAKKFFRNGQIFIQKGNAVYTMTGVRVE